MSILYIVSTPIGNLSDMTFRAIEILKAVDFIAAEDTRHSQKLLSHFDIHTPIFSLHEHNEDERIEKILTLLSEKKSIALISDAGTPLISDPGFRLVRAVRENHFRITPIPGACAAIAALSASGLPTDQFIFEGFLPAKTAALESHLSLLKDETRTVIFYESVHRIVKTLQSMRKILGDQRIVTIARELTKSFETIKQDTVNNLCDWIEKDSNQQKGEFVVLIGADANVKNISSDEKNVYQIIQCLLSELSVKQAVSLACKITGASHKIVYAMALEIKSVDKASETGIN